MSYEWLSDLKAGDRVIVDGGRGLARGRCLRTVDKVTARYIVVSGSKYRRDRGFIASRSAWDTAHLREATPEAVEEVRREARRAKMLHTLREVRWNALPDEVLERVCAIVDEGEAAT